LHFCRWHDRVGGTADDQGWRRDRAGERGQVQLGVQRALPFQPGLDRERRGEGEFVGGDGGDEPGAQSGQQPVPGEERGVRGVEVLPDSELQPASAVGTRQRSGDHDK
jgi:hypothetical protein